MYVQYSPNLIYGASLSYSNVQAGTTDTYTFTFKITNNIPRYGSIRIDFPSAWSSVPSSIQSISTITVYGTGKSGFSVDTSTGVSVRYTNLFDLAGISADSSKTISIQIAGVQNPSSMQTTGSF